MAISSPSLLRKRIQKYLLYAIGEIILIFVGVFAANRVELWRQHQSDKQQIIEALENMKYDVQYDTSRLNSLIIDRYDSKMNGLFSLKGYIEHPYKIKDTLRFLNEIAKGAMFSYWYNPKRTAYGQLANLGLIYKIKDNSLRSQIIEYYDAEEYSSFALKTESDYIDIVNSLRPAYQRRDSLTKYDQKYMLEHLVTEADEIKRSVNKEISHGYTMFRLAIDEKNKGTKILLLIDDYIRSQK